MWQASATGLSQLDTAPSWVAAGYGQASLLAVTVPTAAQSPHAGPSPTGPIAISASQIQALDLAPLQPLYALEPAPLLERSGQLELAFTWPRSEEDPRELSEIAEVRLWSLRADALCPWLPLLLERSGGQLTRHVAMLLPHSFSRSEGIRFAPDSLELWVTHRLFLLDHWSRGHALNCRGNLEQMAAVLGFEIDSGFWQGLD